MTTLIKAQPVFSSTSDTPNELFHTTCCDDDIALCGLDVSGYPETDGDDEWFCVVCEDLYVRDIPCSPICIFID